MPWFRVRLSVFLEAGEDAEALNQVMDQLEGFMIQGSAEEMTPERVAQVLELYKMLEQFSEDAEQGNMIEISGFPGVKFGPQAAAQLTALEFEKRI